MAGKARDWLDLSTGINPRPYPLEPVLSGLQGEDWGRLPQTDAYDNLLAAAHRYYADGSDACGDVVAAPGSEALVQLVPLLLPRSRVVVLGPCYDGHASAWRAVGHMVAEAPSLPAVTPGLVVIVVNPNNPDGRIFDVETLVHYGRSLADRGGLLVVDEAFADLAPEYSLVPRAGQCGVLVLRSFGKFFGLAGLRLGFAFGARKVVARLRTALGAWPVSAPALAVGTAALCDRDWIEQTPGLPVCAPVCARYGAARSPHRDCRRHRPVPPDNVRGRARRVRPPCQGPYPYPAVHFRA